MKIHCKSTLFLLLPVVLAACTQESIPTAALENETLRKPLEATELSDLTSGSPSILTRLNRCAPPGCVLAKNAGPSAFASPLFGLASAPNGDILVADAGAGVRIASGSKSIKEIDLPGVTGISPIGRGTMWASTGSGADPGSDTGQALYRVSNGKNHMIANLFAFEAANNPYPQGALESNPFDVQSLGGSSALVVDAAGNDLLRVGNSGDVTVIAIFPSTLASTANAKALVGCPSPADFCSLPDALPAQAVPTSIAIGPDGYYYVGELRGFPAPTNESSVWRIAPTAVNAICPSQDCVKVFDGGFTSIIDLAFDANGKLLVAEMDEMSWLAVEISGPSAAAGTINSCDLGTMTCTELATEIPMLTAITTGKDATLWATRNALIPGLAEVVPVN